MISIGLIPPKNLEGNIIYVTLNGEYEHINAVALSKEEFYYESILENKDSIKLLEKKGNHYALQNYSLSNRSQDNFIDMLAKCNGAERNNKRYFVEGLKIKEALKEIIKITKKKGLENL